jgi:hypothetical protein
MDGTAFTFQSSYDGTTYNNVYDADGVEYSVTSAGQRDIILDPADFAAIRWLKIRSGTAASATTETGHRYLKLVVRPV